MYGVQCAFDAGQLLIAVGNRVLNSTLTMSNHLLSSIKSADYWLHYILASCCLVARNHDLCCRSPELKVVSF